MTKDDCSPEPVWTYAVDFIRPRDPRIRQGMSSPWREAVRGVDEQTARRSATALRGMKLRFRVQIISAKPDAGQPAPKERTASIRDRAGRVTYRYEGELAGLIPGWATGAEPLEMPEEQKEGESRELAVSGS